MHTERWPLNEDISAGVLSRSCTLQTDHRVFAVLGTFTERASSRPLPQRAAALRANTHNRAIGHQARLGYENTDSVIESSDCARRPIKDLQDAS